MEVIKENNVESQLHENLITCGMWVKVIYEGEYFLDLGLVDGIVASMKQAKTRCLQHPFGVVSSQELEAERDAVFYESNCIFKSPVIPSLIKVQRKWKCTYQL